MGNVAVGMKILLEVHILLPLLLFSIKICIVFFNAQLLHVVANMFPISL